MAELEIRIFGDPVLRQKARRIDDFDGALARLASDMHETMRAREGVGLAANQVGVLKRLFTWEFTDEDDQRHGGAVANPVLVDSSETLEEDDEGCLSFPGLFYPVARPLRVEVDYQDLSGDAHRAVVDGFAARVWLHEMDHLDGVLFIDHLAAHDRRAAQDAMRAYRLDQGLDGERSGGPGGLLLGRRSP
ncbi:MAG: peptide deformylase [Nitriliruptoraceae bacterium]